MTSPGSPALRQLRRLRRSSPDFPRRLDRVLGSEEFKQCLSNLEGDDLTWLVDYLDEAIDDINSSGSTCGERLSSKLREICNSRRVLPTSCKFSSQCLAISCHPFATGGYGDVFKATLDGCDIRIKRVRVPHSKCLATAEKSFCEGVSDWKRLKHQNIVSLLGVTLSPLQLISDWIPNGDLPEYTKNHPSANLIELFSDVAKGIQYLHSYNVIHGEIKGSNVLVDAKDRARLVDFGLTLVTPREHFAVGPYRRDCGPRWSAPEIIVGGVITKAADIFSFPMLMIEIFTGAMPFSGLPGFRAALAITEGVRPLRPAHRAASRQLWEMMQRCWDPDPCLRPEVTEVLQILALNRSSSDDPPLPHHGLDPNPEGGIIGDINNDAESRVRAMIQPAPLNRIPPHLAIAASAA